MRNLMIGVLAAMLLLIVALTAVSSAPLAEPMKFWQSSVIAVTNPNTTPASVVFSVLSSPGVTGTVLYTQTAVVPAGGEYVFNLKDTPNTAVPPNRVYAMNVDSDLVVDAQYRVYQRNANVTINNLTNKAGTYSVAYTAGGAPVAGYSYHGMPIAANEALYLGSSGFSPPATYDGVRIDSTVAIESYMRNRLDWIAK